MFFVAQVGRGEEGGVDSGVAGQSCVAPSSGLPLPLCGEANHVPTEGYACQTCGGFGAVELCGLARPIFCDASALADSAMRDGVLSQVPTEGFE